MPFLSQIPDTQPYKPFARIAGLPFWPGGLTLVAAAPGVGKTSWALDVAAETARAGHFAAFLCYEHTPEELRARLRSQALGRVAGPHPAEEDDATQEAVERLLATATRLFVDMLDDREDTPRRVEHTLRHVLRGDTPALVVVDYLQRVPYVDPMGRSLTLADGRAGAVTAAFKRMALQHGWHIVLIAALEKAHYTPDTLQAAVALNPAAALAALLGDERVAYEADRVLVLFRSRTRTCGCCYDGNCVVAKDRTGPTRTLPFSFWGRVFLPRMEAEGHA